MSNLPRNSCAWGIGTAKSFRNESKSILSTYGTNLQNPSDSICSLYIPDDGKIFVQADCAGAEALIVAYLCRPGNFRELFIQGIKPHIFVAMHIFSEYWTDTLKIDIKPYLAATVGELKTLSRWKELSNAIKHDEMRYFMGKKSCHSFNYGKMPQTFIFDILKETEGKILITKEESEHFHGTYHRIFPEIGEWQREQKNYLYKNRTLRNLQGFPTTLYGAYTDKFFREAISWIPQSTVGCITNTALANIQAFIETNNKDWDVLNNKHDSILIQVPVGQEQIAARTLSDTLEQTLKAPRGEVFTMKSEVSVGMNWGHFNSKTNPDGLKEYAI